jgi:hypothetical protein
MNDIRQKKKKKTRFSFFFLLYCLYLGYHTLFYDGISYFPEQKKRFCILLVVASS